MKIAKTVSLLSVGVVSFFKGDMGNLNLDKDLMKSKIKMNNDSRSEIGSIVKNDLNEFSANDLKRIIEESTLKSDISKLIFDNNYGVDTDEIKITLGAMEHRN